MRLQVIWVVAASSLACAPPSGPRVDSSSSALHWVFPGTPATARYHHTATVLPEGDLLLVGGRRTTLGLPTTAIVSSRSVRSGPLLLRGRADHATIALDDGTILVVGGISNSLVMEVERLDLTGNVSLSAGSIQDGRIFPTANRLRDGRVLLTSGWTGFSYVQGAEIYDPRTSNWKSAGVLRLSRAASASVLLQDGRVLITGGGEGAGRVAATCEIFDPATGTFEFVAPLNRGRYEHSATVLFDGRVLVAGGEVGDGTSTIADAELYDPELNEWTPVASLHEPRAFHSATLLPTGQVLVAGGYASEIRGAARATVELFDPETETWSIAQPLLRPRKMHTATLLPGGDVVFVGGEIDAGAAEDEMEVESPGPDRWKTLSPLAPRAGCTATTLETGVLLVGGRTSSGPSARVELLTAEGLRPLPSLSTARAGHTATQLASGELMVLGGEDSSGPLSSGELLDAPLAAWRTGPTLMLPRVHHRATLTRDGRVLVTGGSPTELSAELVDLRGSAPAAPLHAARREHTATLLRDGSVLVTGGLGATEPQSSTERLAADGSAWELAAKLSTQRAGHTATLLRDGRVLVAGGSVDGSAEVYDPALDQFTATGPMSQPRRGHVAKLLVSGRVLVVGGGAPQTPSTAEVYDPATNAWYPASQVPDGSPEVVGTLPNGTTVFVGSGSVAQAYEAGPPPEPRWPPTLTPQRPLRAIPGQTLTLEGKNLLARSEGSSGGHLSSSSDVAIVVLTHRDSGDTRWLATHYARGALIVTLPATSHRGWHSLSVIVNGIPGPTVPLLVMPDAGLVCGTDAECSSGHCVDGICCDRPCEGVCETCKAASGAIAEGVCSPRAAGTTCKAAASACDLDDRCDGQTGLCVERLAEEGLACEGGGVCRGGTCAPPPESPPKPGCGCSSPTALAPLWLLGLLGLRTRRRWR